MAIKRPLNKVVSLLIYIKLIANKRVAAILTFFYYLLIIYTILKL